MQFFCIRVVAVHYPCLERHLWNATNGRKSASVVRSLKTGSWSWAMPAFHSACPRSPNNRMTGAELRLSVEVFLGKSAMPYRTGNRPQTGTSSERYVPVNKCSLSSRCDHELHRPYPAFPLWVERLVGGSIAFKVRSQENTVIGRGSSQRPT